MCNKCLEAYEYQQVSPICESSTYVNVSDSSYSDSSYGGGDDSFLIFIIVLLVYILVSCIAHGIAFAKARKLRRSALVGYV